MTALARIRALWPDSLFLRLALAWGAALLVTHLLNAGMAYFNVMSYQVTRTSYYLSKDLSVLVPQLEAATPDEAQAWLRRMERKSYYFELGPAKPHGELFDPAHTRPTTEKIRSELGPGYVVGASAPVGSSEEKRYTVLLRNGRELTAHMLPTNLRVPLMGGVIFLLESLVMLLFTWIAVRQATQPLERLAEAAEVLGHSMQCEPIAETGPREVSRAAVAFNAMGRRIKAHLAERVRILAAISHDLQTPITRMRLRADLLDNASLRTKLHSDLDAMQVLVEEGIAYARSADRMAETPCLVDIGALLDTLVCDYLDAGQQLKLEGALEQVATTQPQSLRRIVTNLTDNALKFGEDVEIVVAVPRRGWLEICVRDRGPGIPPEQLARVIEPFYRIESSRNRGTGGTGLGLAIAQQLSLGLGGELSLVNREGGGLAASVRFPSTPARV